MLIDRHDQVPTILYLHRRTTLAIQTQATCPSKRRNAPTQIIIHTSILLLLHIRHKVLTLPRTSRARESIQRAFCGGRVVIDGLSKTLDCLSGILTGARGEEVVFSELDLGCGGDDAGGDGVEVYEGFGAAA